MRLPKTAHTDRPWRIHELTADFRLEGVWALPTPGGPDDFPRLVALMASGDLSQVSSRAARILWAVRLKLGAWLGWDGPDAGLGSHTSTLRDRLPVELRDTHAQALEAPHFTTLYQLDDEWAAEVVNRTVHGVMHLGWVPDQTGGYRGQMAFWSSRTGCLGAPTWPPSPRFDTCSSTRRCCKGSGGPGRRAPPTQHRRTRRSDA